MLEKAIQSPFILEKIKTTSWQNRNSIKDLLLLFRLMSKQKLSAAEGQLYFVLRNRYQEEYMYLLKETNPIKYRVCLEEQERLIQKDQDKQKTKALCQQQLVEEERKEYVYIYTSFIQSPVLCILVTIFVKRNEAPPEIYSLLKAFFFASAAIFFSSLHL